MGQVHYIHRAAPPPFVVIEQPHYTPEQVDEMCQEGLRRLEMFCGRYDTPSERQRIANVLADEKRDLRYLRLHRFIHMGCIAIALFTGVYFAVRSVL